MMDDIIQLEKRHKKLDSVGNFRDLGGYRAECGRTVKWGKLYRSATLFRATERDIATIAGDFGIRHIIDLRKASELELEPHPQRLLDQVEYHWLPINLEGTTRADIEQRLQESTAASAFEGLLIDVNRAMVREHSEDIARWFNIVLEKPQPILFHCTEGKDRTGFTAAMFLSALGVPREQIMHDYMLTNTVNKKSIEERVKNSEVLLSFSTDINALRRLLAVDETYINAAFDQIEQDYGNVLNYLEQALNISNSHIETLKQQYLE